MSKDNLPGYLKLATYKEVFPEVEALEVIAVQDGQGEYLRVGLGKNDYCLLTAPGIIPCRNRECQRGGFELQNYLHQIVDGRETEGECKLFCDGDEGTPGGRKRGIPCSNSCKITVRLLYRS